MNQFTIEIPEVPEGWKPVAFRPRLPGEPYIKYDGSTVIENDNSPSNGNLKLIVKKIQPRRIVLEDTGVGHPESGDFVLEETGFFFQWASSFRGPCTGRIFKVIGDTEE